MAAALGRPQGESDFSSSAASHRSAYFRFTRFRRLVVGAVHRLMRSLENRWGRVEKITQLDEGHTCRLRLKIAATLEVMNAVITKPSCASTSL
jgi:hypothetical protein